MTPVLPIPTDNIYKFACLFGLALIISSIFAFVSTYESSLDRTIKYSETIIQIEAKEQRSKSDNEQLNKKKELIKSTKTNENIANLFIGGVITIGTLLTIYGAFMWHNTIQKRDDKLVALQLEKLEIEIARMRAELAPPT